MSQFLLNLPTVPDECDVIRKERLSGVYRVSALWLAKMTSELPLLFILITISWTVMFFMVGLPHDGAVFAASLGVAYLAGFMGQVRAQNMCE